MTRGPSLLEQSLRDLAPEVTRIAIDDGRTAQAARTFCRTHRPELEARIETVRDVFDDTLEDEIAGLHAPHVALEGGGWIAIQPDRGLHRHRRPIPAVSQRPAAATKPRSRSIWMPHAGSDGSFACAASAG